VLPKAEVMNRIITALIATIFLGLTLIFSCKKDTSGNTCGVDNPLEDLPWLKSRIAIISGSNPQTAKYQFVSQANYRGNTVFIFGNCDPLALSVFPVVSCANINIGNVGEIPADSLLNQVTIWKMPDSLCNF